MKGLGAHHVINYKKDINWGKTAKSLTADGAGVDYVIDVVGANSLGQSLEAVKIGGIINLIGFLGGKKSELTLDLFRGCITRGVHVGSRQQMEEMVNAIEANDIHPIIDHRVFGFEEVRDAFNYVVCKDSPKFNDLNNTKL